MQILAQNLKKGIIKIKVDNTDDLWYLSHIIDKGDLIKGKTLRKIKTGNKEGKSNTIKKSVFIKIRVEKIDFQETVLKLLGKILEGPEDIPRGTYHSFNVEEGSIIGILKENWLRFQIDKLNEAAATEQPRILICILDREEAIFALSKRKGYEILTSLEGEVQKKDEKVIAKGSFYEDLIKLLEDYTARYKIKNIIVASPIFWKEELIKHVKDEHIKEKITLATCSSVGKNAIDEVMKRPEVKEVLKQVRVAKEINLVEEFLTALAKKEPVAYGLKEVQEAANAGAVKALLVTDSFIHKMRETERYSQLDYIMRLVEQTKGEINIISSEHEAGRKLDGLGGLGAILRYRIN
jgi:protein pelota